MLPPAVSWQAYSQWSLGASCGSVHATACCVSCRAYGQWSLGAFCGSVHATACCQLAGLWSVVIRGLPVAVFVLPPAVSVSGPIVSGH